MTDDLERKISTARTRLILDHPFLGVLVLRLPLVAAQSQWCPTTATDMKSFYYNPEYLQALGARQVEFVLAHEALHCALAHFTRRGHRVKHRWDLACDFAINPILLEEGLTAPANAVTFFEYAGMTAEEIYPMLRDNENNETMDQHIYGGHDTGRNEDVENSSAETSNNKQRTSSTDGTTKPTPISSEEMHDLASRWQQQLTAAAQRASEAGKLSGALAKLVGSLLRPQLSWRALLARYMVSTAREDYDYSRPSRRESAAILPSLRNRQINIAVVVDTSGSLTDAEIVEFLGEVESLKGQVSARVSLFACDTQLVEGSPWIFEAWDELRLPSQLSRGGGTNFTPPFYWYRDKVMPPDLLVYFTDALGEFPAAPPNFPVLWLVKGHASVPWGTRVQLNE